MTTVAVRERGILFSGAMVRAILEGRKTQTRRVVTQRTSDVGSGREWAHLDLSKAWPALLWGVTPGLKAPASFAPPEYCPETWPDHGNAPLAIAAGIALDKTKIERLEAWVADLQSGMYVNCVYCGHRYGPGETTPVSMADALKAHIEQCPEHPMSALKRENEALRALLSEQPAEPSDEGERVAERVDRVRGWLEERYDRDVAVNGLAVNELKRIARMVRALRSAPSVEEPTNE